MVFGLWVAVDFPSSLSCLLLLILQLFFLLTSCSEPYGCTSFHIGMILSTLNLSPHGFVFSSNKRLHSNGDIVHTFFFV